MKKVYKITSQIICGSALVILGLLLGLRAAQQDILQEMQRSTVQTIAIVNMDEGVMTGTERVYYAEKMFAYPDMDYEVTDLNDAMSGVDEGKFAAYIIIPADFSQSVSSINAEPSRASLEYAVNTNLRDDVNEQVRAQIAAFENRINNNIEYMYLAAVLQEFHEAQDSAQVIMQNDTEDMEILMQVQPEDISETVVLENGETVPYDIAMLDLMTYYDSNADLIAAINDYYDRAQEEADAVYQQIAEAGEQVGTDIDEVSAVMAQINIFVDEQGNDLLAKEQETIEAAITETEEHNREVTDAVAELAASMKLPTMLYEDGEIAEVMRALQECLNETVETGGYRDPLLSDQEEDGEDNGGEDNNGEDNSDMDTAQKNTAAVSAASRNAEQEEEPEEKEAREEEEPKEGKEQEESEEGKAQEQEEPEEGKAQVQEEPEEGKAQEEETEERETQAQEGAVNGGQNTEEIGFQLYIAQSQTSSTQEDQKKEDVEDEDENLPQFPMIDTETQPFTVVRSAEINQLRMQQVILYRLLRETEKYEPVNYDGIMESISVNLMEPMAENQEQAVKSVAAAQDAFLDSSVEYLTQMSEFSILDYLDLDGIYDNMEQFDANVADMYGAIAEQDEQYNQYVEDVYTATEEWKELWRTDIETADAASLAKLDTGLAAAKESRETSNATNVMLLYEFTGKLPYTRLGSLEYTNTYQFMVSPVTFTDTGGAHRYAYVSETRDYDSYIVICLAILLGLAAGTALVHVIARGRSGRRGEQWNAYE